MQFIVIVFISLNLTSCFYGIGDDDPTIVGRNNTYKGIVVDLNGNPVAGKTVVLRSSFDQHIAEFITDENGRFEGQGDIYDTSLNVGIKNDGNVLTELGGQVFTASNYFTEYTFEYTNYPSGETVEFPPLIYAPISSIGIEIINNTGQDYSGEVTLKIGVCLKRFEDNIELDSRCYEDEIIDLSTVNNGDIRTLGRFAVLGSTVTITFTNSNNTITESFLINEINKETTIIFDWNKKTTGNKVYKLWLGQSSLGKSYGFLCYPKSGDFGLN